jgi:hypothetical protein
MRAVGAHRRATRAARVRAGLIDAGVHWLLGCHGLQPLGCSRCQPAPKRDCDYSTRCDGFAPLIRSCCECNYLADTPLVPAPLRLLLGTFCTSGQP